MINIVDKVNCCGCEACAQVCPRHCISYVEDEEGFLYPSIARNDCVDCGLCEKSCPIINQKESTKPFNVFAAKNPDDSIRLNSSSGGVFSLFAERILEQNGVVFGAKWNEKWEVVHGYTDTKDDLSLFRGSKYVQSAIGTSYIDALRFLKEGRKVLFSGTPCQIAGLKMFLHKEYDNLFTVDFICHGVPSPGVFRWYLQEELNDFAQKKSMQTVTFRPSYSIPKRSILVPNGISVQDIRFRDKRKGWKKYGFAIDLSIPNAEGENKTYSLFKSQEHYSFLKGMNYYLRPSCYDCKFKLLKSGSDLTIADYWGIQVLLPDYEDDKGISAIIVNSTKADHFINSLHIETIETGFQDIKMRNSSLEHSASLNSEKRQLFFDRTLKKSFKNRVDEVTRVPFLCKLKSLPRAIIYGVFGENRIIKLRNRINNVNC